MKFENIKKQVEYLEDRIIKNFDKYFSELVLLDFYEGGFEDRLEDPLFYEEYFSEYESTIIDLLLLIKKKSSEKYLDLKLRLIKMKRIIDTSLSQVVNDELVTNTPNIKRKHNRSFNFLLNQNLDTEKLIESLYNKLENNKLINTKFLDFKTHFKDNWRGKIQWLGTEIQITNLIYNLININLLDTETQNFKYKLISTHFINKRGKPFNEKQLGTVYSEKKDFIPNDDIILKIISEMSLIFH